MFSNHSCCQGTTGWDYIPLNIDKRDSVTGAGLSGAVFELIANNNFVCRGTTNANGFLRFCILPCNMYILREVIPPSGYMPVANVYTICVDGCGRIVVDGVLTERLVITNTAITASFTAVKVNSENSQPLAGAVYTLYLGVVPVASTTSTATGAVTFTNLSPGAYVLVETVPPPGFQADMEQLPVMVAQDGSVTILGQPAEGYFLTDTPLG